MNNLSVTIAVFLVVLVITATADSDSAEEPKTNDAAFTCRVNMDCLNYIACKHCSFYNCICDSGTCKCKTNAPTPSPASSIN
ncbi:hypothetical protein EUTSA_v10026701mg [Eutrema salsugineum]|uniref:Uncharacterized protein n=1 Tax=Eutrema salsugineum TaxID=72664 RepID=V4MLB5_EUTSA|nr:hypothetical protein EUTSA_v10026701mg [Eutrema salsugineum]